MLAREIKTALQIAWLVLSVAAGGVLLTPFLLTPAAVDSLAPVCQWRARHHRECAFCGMTRSFLAISRGGFGEAAERNRGSIPLYVGLLGNEGAALAFMLGRARRAARGWHWASEDLACRL